MPTQEQIDEFLRGEREQQAREESRPRVELVDAAPARKRPGPYRLHSTEDVAASAAREDERALKKSVAESHRREREARSAAVKARRGRQAQDEAARARRAAEDKTTRQVYEAEGLEEMLPVRLRAEDARGSRGPRRHRETRAEALARLCPGMVCQVCDPPRRHPESSMVVVWQVVQRPDVPAEICSIPVRRGASASCRSCHWRIHKVNASMGRRKNHVSATRARRARRRQELLDALVPDRICRLCGLHRPSSRQWVVSRDQRSAMCAACHCAICR